MSDRSDRQTLEKGSASLPQCSDCKLYSIDRKSKSLNKANCAKYAKPPLKYLLGGEICPSKIKK